MNKSEEEKQKYVNTVIYPDELREVKRAMEYYIQELENACKECFKKIEESEELYRSPSATYFRDQANEYLYKEQKYIDEVVKGEIRKIDLIIDTYEETFNDVKKEVEEKTLNFSKTV